jgi:ABC-type nitrate/sulfonate/bicarbonate transport system substrate-binding protein
MKKILLVAIIFLVLAGLLIKTPKKPVEKKLQKVTIMMPMIPQIQWASYYTAINKGYYRDEGLDIDIQYSNKGNAGSVEQLVGGKVDLVLTGEETVIIARSKGSDVVAVYPIEPTNVYYIVSRKDLNLTKLSDLPGKKIGIISTASGAYNNLLVLLNLAKADINDVELIQAGTSVVQAFLEREFDVATVHLNQKLLIQAKVPDVNIISDTDYTNISRGHIAVMGKLIKEKPELIEKFLKATKKGLDYAVSHPKEAVDIYISINPDAKSQKEAHQNSWNNIIKAHNYKISLPGLEKSQDWQESQDVLFNIGSIAKKTDVSSMFTNKFIPK